MDFTIEKSLAINGCIEEGGECIELRVELEGKNITVRVKDMLSGDPAISFTASVAVLEKLADFFNLAAQTTKENL